MWYPRAFCIVVVAAMVIGVVGWALQHDPEDHTPELPGTMVKVAVGGGIKVWHLQYKDRHYLVTSKGGIMILPRWIEGSAKVAPPLERLGTRRQGSEPPIVDRLERLHQRLLEDGQVITGEIK